MLYTFIAPLLPTTTPVECSCYLYAVYFYCTPPANRNSCRMFLLPVRCIFSQSARQPQVLLPHARVNSTSLCPSSIFITYFFQQVFILTSSSVPFPLSPLLPSHHPLYIPFFFTLLHFFFIPSSPFISSFPLYLLPFPSLPFRTPHITSR